MVLVTENTMGGLGAGIESFGSSLGQVLQQRGQKQQQQQQQQQSANLIQEAIAQSEIDPNTGAPNIESLLQNVYGAIQQGANPEMATSFLKNYGDLSKDRNANVLQQRKDLSAIETAKLNLKHEKTISKTFNSLGENYSREDLQDSVAQLVEEGVPYETIKKQLDNFKLPELTQTERTQIHSLKNAEKTLEEMNRLATTGYAGTTFGFPIAPYAKFGQRAADRAEMEKLGQSLIPIVSAGVSIRNQKEFDEYKSIITDPNAQISTLRGAIKGLQKMVKNQLDLLEPGRDKKEEEAPQRYKKVKKGTVLTDRALVSKLLRDSEDDLGKAMELARSLGYTVE